MDSASALSDTAREDRPKELRASKNLCVRGGCLSLMIAVGGATSASTGKRLVLVSRESTAMGSAVVVAEAAGAGGAGSDRSGSTVVMVVEALGSDGAGSAAAKTAKVFDGKVVASAPDFVEAGDAFNATAASALDDELDDAARVNALESDVEDEPLEAESGAGEAEFGETVLAEVERGPRSSVAEADGPKSANIMAHAMASLTSLPLM